MISTVPDPVSACATAPPYNCILTWRLKMLVVKKSNQLTCHLSSLRDPQRLAACLQRSPVTLVKLDPGLSEEILLLWADACQQSEKAAFLRLPSALGLPHKRAKFTWLLKCVFDRVAALLLLLLLLPLMVGVALLIWLRSPGSVFFRQWRVGKRGRLFQILKFRTMFEGAEQLHHQVMQHQSGLHKREDDPRLLPIGRWLRKYSLDELPQLINVLRGEMSLVGPRPWALYDAVRVSSSMQHRLNALPGITGVWQIKTRSHLRDIDAVNRCDLDYLQNWSPLQDLKILLLTIPKVLTGFGAY